MLRPGSAFAPRAHREIPASDRAPLSTATTATASRPVNGSRSSTINQSDTPTQRSTAVRKTCTSQAMDGVFGTRTAWPARSPSHLAHRADLALGGGVHYQLEQAHAASGRHLTAGSRPDEDQEGGEPTASGPVEPGAPRGVTRRPVLQRQRTLRANSCTNQRPKPADESRLDTPACEAVLKHYGPSKRNKLTEPVTGRPM